MKISNLYRNCKNLDFLDIYSQQVHLKIQGKKNYSSLISLSLSILSLITMIVISTTFLISAIKRKAVSVIYNVDSMDYPIVNLTEYPMTFQLADAYGRIFPEQDRIFQMTAMYSEFSVILDQNNSTKIKNDYKVIQLEKCDINKHFAKYKDYFLEVPDLSKKYCWPANSFNLTLYGKYGDVSRGFSMIQFFLQKCMNGTNGKESCYETKKIDDILSLVNLEYSQMDYDINHDIPYDSRVLTKRSDVFQLSSTVYKRVFRYLNHVKYSSDYGYLFEDIYRLEFFQHDRDEISQDLRKEGMIAGSFSSLTVICSPKIQKYSRVSIKLQSLLANIDGIFKGITFSVRILHFVLSKNIINFVIYKSLFKNLENPGKKLLKNRIEDILNEDKEDTHNNPQNSMINFKENVHLIKIYRPDSEIRMKNTQGKKISKNDQITKNIFFNFLDIISPNFMKKRKKSVFVYDKFKTWLYFNTSIENILEKLLEVDLLKKKCDELFESNKYKSESSNQNFNLDAYRLEIKRKNELN